MNDGGPAFPHTHIIGINGMLHDTQSIGGMSLRAYFAGLAMQAIIQSSVSSPAAAQAFIENTKGFGGMADRTTAAISMAYADAMIAALEVRHE